MKRLIVGLTLMMAASLALGEVAVTGVTAKQRYPWNGLVDITVTLSGTEDECTAATFPFYATNRATRAELPVGSVKAIGAITGAGNTWTRRFVWNATADVGCAKFGEVELSVGAPSVGVQLWEGGPYWAECNVGATKPEECGCYFWWGDTVGCKRNANNDGWVSVKDATGFSFVEGNCQTYGKSNAQLQSDGYIDSTGTLVAAHDAATAYLGVPWRMPTTEELDALISHCKTEWTMRNGVPGQLVMGKGAYSTKSIFLVAAGLGADTRLSNLGSCGYYWTSSPHSGGSDNAWRLYFDSGSLIWGYDRSYYGRSVRPVRGFAK